MSHALVTSDRISVRGLIVFRVMGGTPGSASTYLMRWCSMVLLLWFSVCVPMAASADLLRIILRAVGAVSFVAGLLRTANDCCEGQRAVKGILMFEEWLKADERCSNSGSNAPKRVRNASISYETVGTGGNFAGEDFQNIETFIVVRSSVFSKSSAHKTHLARDAYNTYSRRAGRRQVQFFQLSRVRFQEPDRVRFHHSQRKKTQSDVP